MPETVQDQIARDAAHEREVQLVAEALCRCAQTQGRHARDCTTPRALRAGRLSDALAAHDRRLHRAAEEFCTSCGEHLDPGTMLRVNGVPYHLGNCPRPHGDTRP